MKGQRNELIRDVVLLQLGSFDAEFNSNPSKQAIPEAGDRLTIPLVTNLDCWKSRPLRSLTFS